MLVVTQEPQHALKEQAQWVLHVFIGCAPQGALVGAGQKPHVDVTRSVLAAAGMFPVGCGVSKDPNAPPADYPHCLGRHQAYMARDLGLTGTHAAAAAMRGAMCLAALCGKCVVPLAAL